MEPYSVMGTEIDPAHFLVGLLSLVGPLLGLLVFVLVFRNLIDRGIGFAALFAVGSLGVFATVWTAFSRPWSPWLLLTAVIAFGICAVIEAKDRKARAE